MELSSCLLSNLEGYYLVVTYLYLNLFSRLNFYNWMLQKIKTLSIKNKNKQDNYFNVFKNLLTSLSFKLIAFMKINISQDLFSNYLYQHINKYIQKHRTPDIVIVISRHQVPRSKKSLAMSFITVCTGDPSCKRTF